MVLRGAFFAGAIYGFGPFMLGLGKYHPAAGLMAAAIPWLFLPAAFGPGGNKRWLRVPLAMVPILAIIGFFWLSAQLRLFAMPIQVKLRISDLAGLLLPLVSAKRAMTLIGFYHVPIAGLMVGLALLWKGKRYGVMAILTAGLVLGFCDGFLNVSPVMWLSLPVLCSCVIIGEGLEAITLAGAADKKWVLVTTVVMGGLAVAALILFPGFGFLGLEEAKMYLLGAVSVGIIFFVAQGKLRLHRVRWIVLCSAMAVDIFLGAVFVVDKVF